MSEFTQALEKLFGSGEPELVTVDVVGEESAEREGTVAVDNPAAHLSVEERALYESITSSIADVSAITSSDLFTKLFGDHAKSIFQTITSSEEYHIVQKNFELSKAEEAALGIPEKRLKGAWEQVLSDIKMLCKRVDKLTAVGNIGKTFLSTSAELAKFYLVRYALAPRIAVVNEILDFASHKTTRSANSIHPVQEATPDFSEHKDPLRTFFTFLKFISSVYGLTSQLAAPLKNAGKFLISGEEGDIERVGTTPSSFAKYISGLATMRITKAVAKGTEASTEVLMDLAAALTDLSIFENSGYAEAVAHLTNYPDSLSRAISNISIHNLDIFRDEINEFGDTTMEMIAPENAPELANDKRYVLEAFFKMPESWSRAEKKISGIIRAVKG